MKQMHQPHVQSASAKAGIGVERVIATRNLGVSKSSITKQNNVSSISYAVVQSEEDAEEEVSSK